MGMSYFGKIKTYGELCSAIEDLKEDMREIRKQINYEEFESDVDFKLRLIDLVKIKKEEELKQLEEFGYIHCLKCGSKVNVREDLQNDKYYYISTCPSCGHEIVKDSDKGGQLDALLDPNYEYHQREGL